MNGDATHTQKERERGNVLEDKDRTKTMYRSTKIWHTKLHIDPFEHFIFME